MSERASVLATDEHGPRHPQSQSHAAPLRAEVDVFYEVESTFQIISSLVVVGLF